MNNLKDILQKGDWFLLLGEPTRWDPSEYDLYDPNDMKPLFIFTTDFQANKFDFILSSKDNSYRKLKKEVDGIILMWDWKERSLAYKKEGDPSIYKIDRVDTTDKLQRLLRHIGLEGLADDWKLCKKSNS